jgi:hypothetical protein
MNARIPLGGKKIKNRPELALHLSHLLGLLLEPLLLPGLRLLQQRVVRQLHVARVQRGRALPQQSTVVINGAKICKEIHEFCTERKSAKRFSWNPL